MHGTLLLFLVFISPIVWNMCEHLHYGSVYFKELHNEQDYYWPTIYKTGAAVMSTITSLVRRLWRSTFVPETIFRRIEQRVRRSELTWARGRIFQNLTRLGSARFGSSHVKFNVWSRPYSNNYKKRYNCQWSLKAMSLWWPLHYVGHLSNILLCPYRVHIRAAWLSTLCQV